MTGTETGNAPDLSQVCIDPGAPWTGRNDRMVAAIELSHHQPEPALEQIRTLLAEGINLNARHETGRTALEYARYLESTSAVIALLSYAAQYGTGQPLMPDPATDTPTPATPPPPPDSVAAQLNLQRVVTDPQAAWTAANDRLLEAVQLSNSQPETAKHQITEVLNAGVNINAKNDTGRTALEYARYFECPSSVVALLEHASDHGTGTGTAADLEPPPVDPDKAVRTLPIAFHGTARGYFRVWAVNLCLTLVTLGIFSAWAKVRKKRYFYSHTTFDGTPFQYLAQPMPIFKGRVIAVILLAIWYVSTNFVLAMVPYVLVATLVLLPWVVTRSAQFNCRYSAWRNMTFNFSGTYFDTFLSIYIWGIFFALSMIALISESWAWYGAIIGLFTLCFPFWLAKQRRYLLDHTRFGGQPAKLSITGFDFYVIYFLAGIVTSVVGGGAGLLIDGASDALKQSEHAKLVALLALVPGYLGYMTAYAFIKVRTNNLVWNSLTLGPIRFQSDIPTGGYIKLYLVNALAILFSCGFLIPWAAVRIARYRAEHMHGLVQGSLAQFEGSEASRVNAAGAEISEFFDVDISL